MQIQICQRFCINFAYCIHGNERYTMGVNLLQISCMLICKSKANLVNVIFTMTLLITLHVRKSDFSSGEAGGEFDDEDILHRIISIDREYLETGKHCSKSSC